MNTVTDLFKTCPGMVIMVLIVLLLFVSWFIDRTYTFFVELFWGPSNRSIYERPPPRCEHPESLSKLCLRGASGCGTKRDCDKAVEEGDY